MDRLRYFLPERQHWQVLVADRSPQPWVGGHLGIDERPLAAGNVGLDERPMQDHQFLDRRSYLAGCLSQVTLLEDLLRCLHRHPDTRHRRRTRSRPSR